MSEDPSENKKMSFLGHLEELRWRLVKVAIAVVAAACVLFYFTEFILDTVYISMLQSNFPTYKFFCGTSQILGLDDSLCASTIDATLQSTKPMSQFSTNMYFAIVGGLSVTFPFTFYQIWGFIKPGLKSKEVAVTKGIVFYASILFFTGIAFGYFVLSPLCVQFFGNYSMSNAVSNDFTIGSFMSMITTTTFLSGIFFQLPVVMYALAKLSIVTPELLKKYRKHALVVVLILSAVITPPDVISQIIVAIPIMGLYEIGIYVSKVVQKNKAK